MQNTRRSTLQEQTKWFARIVLILLVLGMVYVVVQPEYNFAHWIPHDVLDQLGISYLSQLWLEQNADLGLHFFGSAVLYLLIWMSQWAVVKSQETSALLLVLALCIAAEVVQHVIGRGFSERDLLLGFLGTFVAYFAARLGYWVHRHNE